MTIAAEMPLMTTEEFLAMQDDGIERDLTDGIVREIGRTTDVIPRSPLHGSLMANVVWRLGNWSDARPEPRGRVYCGEVGFRLRRTPDNYVGIDVAYVSAETAAATPKNAKFVEGPPILAVEILSPSDKQELIIEKIEDYLKAGTKAVWSLEPVFEALTIYRPGVPPVLLTGQQEVVGDAAMPGFRCTVAELFAF